MAAQMEKKKTLLLCANDKSGGLDTAQKWEKKACHIRAAVKRVS